MNRLQKKCFIVSTGFHGLLLIVVLFGAALMPEPEETNSFKPINVYSADTVSDLLSHGGDPNAGAATPAPPAPVANPSPAPPAPARTEIKPEVAQPKPQVVPTPKPEIIREPARHAEPPKIAREDPPKNAKPKVSLPEEDHAIPPKRHKLDPRDLQKVNRNDAEKQADAAANKAAQAQANAERRRNEKQFASTLRSLKNNLSSDTLVQTTPGVGGGGEVSVNYGSIIFSKYYNAWIAPAMLEDDTPVVTASVTIARNGQVIASHIIKSSGNKVMDRSVASALENVTYIAPFPENSTDQERTVTIEFNVQAKKQSG